MKKEYKSIVIILVLILAIMVPFSSCSQSGNSAEEDMMEDLGGDLASELAGGDVSAENIWPESMPEQVPEFTKGIIVNTSGVRVGGQLNITVMLESVSQEDHDLYVEEIEDTIFELLTSSDSGGIASKMYVEGDNAISLQYAAKTGEMTISFSGN